ncbi:MAG TPA: Gfo/Idh/MocA family oxidoreductase [Candidatus Omnitrophota bacterium]|nr:Gfo/Idh/MocA family oxidoreductase [Candidatus Omnitrophota bacterium]
MSSRVAIVGCGRIGQKRSKALSDARLVVCADQDISRAKALAEPFSNVAATSDVEEVLRRKDVDIVIVATTNDVLTKISLQAIRAGKHVLVEKPGARSSEELKELIAAAEKTNVKIRVGFNHRYHPALQKANELVQAGELGELMFVRGRYGHGGRLGYEKEWRADPKLSGGGELIDQGVHLIDLARWFLGDFTKVSGFAHTYFWKMPVDDNGFMLLQTPAQQVAFLHVSCTEWKNLFSFEIYGKKAKLSIEGLGGSYGAEKLFFYKMLPEMGPPETTKWEFPEGDNSWNTEFAEFLEDIRLSRAPAASLRDACEALAIVEKIEKESGYDYHT